MVFIQKKTRWTSKPSVKYTCTQISFLSIIYLFISIIYWLDCLFSSCFFLIFRISYNILKKKEKKRWDCQMFMQCVYLSEKKTLCSALKIWISLNIAMVLIDYSALRIGRSVCAETSTCEAFDGTFSKESLAKILSSDIYSFNTQHIFNCLFFILKVLCGMKSDRLCWLKTVITSFYLKCDNRKKK